MPSGGKSDILGGRYLKNKLDKYLKFGYNIHIKIVKE
jgi:hypothetical protein